MDLDPRLRPDRDRDRDRGGQASPSAAKGTSPSTPSPSSQPEAPASSLHRHHLQQRPHGATEGSDSPSSLGTPSNNNNNNNNNNNSINNSININSHINSSHNIGGGGSNQKQQQQQQQQQQGGEDGADAKKSRACEACRGLKVRCEPDPDDDDAAPCKRCRKAGRRCVVTAPTRKRQKKTDSRVSELEKKIDALTASLQARAAAPTPGVTTASAATGVLDTIWGNGDGARSWRTAEAQSTPPAPAPGRPHQHQQRRPSVLDEPVVTAGQKRKASDHLEGSGEDSRLSPASASTAWPAPAPVPRSTEGDIVDRGLVTTEKAAELFSRYKEHMIRHLPAVIFPPSMSVVELRRTKPYLFLAVMAAASSEMSGLQRVLHKELMQLFAHKVVVAGEKNLELVQALHVAVIWYWPPEHFEELKFYQLVHMAAVMALDIGLGKKAPSRRGIPPFSWREHQFKRQPQPDPASIECRRTWLTCHFLAANTSMSLHRPNLIRWTPFMTESLELLESSPDAAPTDKYLCHLVWTHRMGEEIGVQFSMDDPATPVNILDPRTQYALRSLERDLEKYRDAVSRELMQPTLKMNLNLLNLYMHELVLHSDTPTDQFRPPFNTEIIKDGMVSAEPLSAAHINALSACLTAIDGIFATFLSMDLLSIRCLPVFNFVRIAYAVVVLMKMYFSASSPKSELGKVINKDNMRVEHYLDALLDKFRTTAAEDKCRPAAKFLIVLAMLRSWFVKQGKDANASAAPAVAGGAARPPETPSKTSATPPDGSSIAHAHHGVNTPLQVLSEVAMGREHSGPPRHVLNHISGLRQTPQPIFHDSVSPSGSTSNTNTNTNNPSTLSSTADVDPAAPIAAPGAAPFPSPWMSHLQAPPPAGPAMGLAAGLPPDFDLESLGAGLAEQDVYEGGTRMILNEPWFNDMFQGLPDPNYFPF
ncbi:Transcriptional regulator WAR1 [Tolypocladium ophioglossoides CBS 100239]|uniref:Transcriptional regulator WAR1 n=1 Tax=Tolypocladium ophioglossoides (strain CBS 100239) TaxID=1163406 RepID=A0A0L0N7K7_TOLOC|nr:Transcriptional regulator WAR1 [Tolypocladium ophioglossoides CBS 100239]